MTNYQGIDYGTGQTNIDIENNIRFGVIPVNEILQAWADDSEPIYIYACPYCGNELEDYPDFDISEDCPYCKTELKENDFYDNEPIGYKYDKEGYKAYCGNRDIFIEKSPYYTYAQFCSPCAPGACYLMEPLDKPNANNKCYCFGHDWFENEKAPYPVYSVKTNKIV